MLRNKRDFSLIPTDPRRLVRRVKMINELELAARYHLLALPLASSAAVAAEEARGRKEFGGFAPSRSIMRSCQASWQGANGGDQRDVSNKMHASGNLGWVCE